MRRLTGETDWRHAVTASEPDVTLMELQGRLASKGIRISLQAINTTLAALGYRYKKTAHAAEQERADVAAKRRLWRNWQTWSKPERLVFVDESGAAGACTQRCPGDIGKRPPSSPA